MAFTWQDDQLWSDLPGAGALFTTRRGGVSTGPFESLNLGRWTEDAPTATDENRRRIEQMVGAPLAYGRQVHGTAVRRVHEPTGTPGEHDGLVTDARGVGLMVLAADCLPIIVTGGGALAALHGGWRGLSGGIVAGGVAELRSLTGPSAELTAAIGPGAGPCCYEVSDAVHAAFAELGPDVRHGQRLDLKAVARRQLQAAGVTTVEDCGLCTMCDSRFFSHRRDGPRTGRQAGIAWRS